MTGLSARPPYSYRTDAAIPAFDDGGPVAVMDGDCALCCMGARMIARFDRATEIRICRAQTELGAALLRHYGLAPGDPESWLFIVDGQAHGSLDGIIRVGAQVGGVGRGLQALRLLPRPARDWLYRRIARNRYGLFGKADMCAIPDPALRARLIE